MRIKKVSEVLNRKLFLYGGIKRDEFESVKEWRDMTNRRNWTVISGLAAIYFAVLFFTTFSVRSVEVNACLYAMLSIFSTVICIMFSTLAKVQITHASTILSYLMLIMLLSFGIVVGVLSSPEYLAVTYNVMIIALPLLLADRPWRIALTLLCSTSVYVALCEFVETGETRELDIYNAICFSGIALIIVFYNGYNKMNAALNLRKLEMANLTDGLTGLGNRKAFDKYVDDYIGMNIPDNLAVASIDINGLKIVNDRYGHAAGDELIEKAAMVLKESFREYGQVYRIGGDEFFAGFFASAEEIDLIGKDINAKAENIEIKSDLKISFSVGFATAKQYPGLSVDQLTRISDKKMYENKSRYYLSSGQDRRKQSLPLQKVTE